jgi:hypothetical protein
MAENSLDDLWERPAGATGPAADAPPDPQPAALPEPSPLEREVYQLRGMVQGLAQGMQRPPEPPPQYPDYSWKEQEFLNADEQQLILNGKLEEFPQRLNRYLNSVGKTVHENLVGEIQKRDAALWQLRHESQSGLQQFAAQQQQQAFRQEFFQQHEDLKEDEFLVTQAAQTVANEFSRQPWAYSSPQQILGRIGEVARGMRQQYLQRWGSSGGEASGPPAVGASPIPSPARRAQVETGGSTRVGQRPASSDPQRKAISAMLGSMRQRKR